MNSIRLEGLSFNDAIRVLTTQVGLLRHVLRSLLLRPPPSVLSVLVVMVSVNSTLLLRAGYSQYTPTPIRTNQVTSTSNVDGAPEGA